LYNPWGGELDNAIQSPPYDIYSYTDEYSTAGILARAQYDYDGTYFLSASLRRDGSSRFHPDNRWGTFGSLGGAWLMSKENFLSDVEWIDVLKFKASYGMQGNDNLLYPDGTVNNHPYQNQYNVTSDGVGGFALVETYHGNKDITWETSHAFNTGFDFELLGGYLAGTIEYFNRTTSDLLFYRPEPLSAGIASTPLNIGSVRNSGLEIDLSSSVFKNNDWDWSVFANATFLKNEILSLDPEVEAAGGQKFSNSIYKVGGSLYQFYLVQTAGIDQETGKQLYYIDPNNGDFTTTDDYTKAHQADLGDGLADVYGGFGTTVKYKDFDLSVQLAYQLGGSMYDGSYSELMHSGQGSRAGTNWHKDILNSWTPENHSNSIPRLATSDPSFQDVQSSRFITSTDYLSLNNITLGYTVPAKLLNNWGISSIRVYVTGDNLALLTARKGLDPRLSFAGGSSTSGSGSFVYSALRTVSGGVSLTF
jgi:TonB-linked SusC/RagA family outer membrane protein